jgi:predicted nucleic acid-binding protein
MRAFLDTNVLVYAHDTDASDKRAVALELTRSLWDAREGALSTQVLQEFYVNMTAKIPARVSTRAARDLVRAYSAWHVVGVDATDILEASELQERSRLSFWDALIVTAALKANADVLFTEDLHPKTRIRGLEVRNPFATPRG